MKFSKTMKLPEHFRKASKTHVFYKDTLQVNSYIMLLILILDTDTERMGCVWGAFGLRLGCHWAGFGACVGSVSGATWSVRSHNQNRYIHDIRDHLTGVFTISGSSAGSLSRCFFDLPGHLAGSLKQV